MVFVGTLFVGGEGGDAGGVGGFDDGVEVERGAARLVAEVGEVEGGAAGLSFYAGHKFANLHLKFHSIDMDDIVGACMVGA